MKSYCTQNDGDCQTCSLGNYDRDCQDQPITKAEGTGTDTPAEEVRAVQVETTRQNKMCIRLGDGLHACSDCLSAAYPDMDNPETGWELAFCDYC